MGNVEYSFIAIAPRSTLVPSGSNWQGLMYESNGTKLRIYAKWRSSEISWQVHLPRQLRLTYWNNVNIRLARAWNAIDRILIVWKADLSDKIKRDFFQAVVSILLYRCTAWTLTKSIEKKFDGNCTRMLQAILYKSWKQNPTKQQLYEQLPALSKTIHIRRTRNAVHCWRIKDELISDVFLRTPSYKRASISWPTRTYLQQLYTNSGCSLEDLSGAMDDRDEWRENQGNQY